MLEPVVLAGHHVRLEPLSPDHFDALCEIGLDEDLWRWTPQQITTREQLRAYVDDALRERDEGRSLPFAIVALADDAVAGCTRYGNIDSANRRLEIGWTWIGRSWQRTAVNTETKLQLLTHAFETLRMNRVELKTDALNERSRRAILRIGAKEEGTLRRHMVTESGRLRDTVYFSILDDEWPAVKGALEERLGNRS
ncbi:MAG TPA: GNAT family protein [Gammaproteobacteria bacterium]